MPRRNIPSHPNKPYYYPQGTMGRLAPARINVIEEAETAGQPGLASATLSRGADGGNGCSAGKCASTISWVPLNADPGDLIDIYWSINGGNYSLVVAGLAYTTSPYLQGNCTADGTDLKYRVEILRGGVVGDTKFTNTIADCGVEI